MFSFDENALPSNKLDSIAVHQPSDLLEREIVEIRRVGDSMPPKDVGLAASHDESHVRVSGARIPHAPATGWIYDRMRPIAEAVNRATFGFTLSGFETFCYLRYDRPGDHFGWHVDSGIETPHPRKLSLILQLSDPSEYDGGELQLMTSCASLRVAPKTRGLVTAFASFRMHRITPVTRGVRRSLLIFAVGPNFN